MKIFSSIRAFLNQTNGPAIDGYGRTMLFCILMGITVTAAVTFSGSTYQMFTRLVDGLDFGQDCSKSDETSDLLDGQVL
jgi:hypothetical protein